MAYVIGAVLAAGRGVRMGGPKATLIVDGQRLIDRAIVSLAGGGCDRIVAVVGAGVAIEGVAVDGVEVDGVAVDGFPRDRAVSDHAGTIVNPAPERGMRSSLALAIEAAADIQRVVDPDVRSSVGLAVLLVDTPGIDAAAVRAVVGRWRRSPSRIAVGRFEGGRSGEGRSVGRRGHPTVMAVSRWREALLLAGADEGARSYLQTNPDLIDEVLVDGDPADLDRPEDLQAWRRNH